MIAHHVSDLGIAIELGVVVAVAVLFAVVWWQGQRRRKRPPAKPREK